MLQRRGKRRMKPELPLTVVTPDDIARKRCFTAIRQLWDNARRIWIFAHESPDGDALGSTLALEEVLSGLGKEASLFVLEPVSRIYSELPRVERIQFGRELPDTPPDLVQVNDTGSFQRIDEPFREQLTRLGIGPEVPDSRRLCPLINFDHHVGNTEFGELNYIDTGASAVGEMMFQLCEYLGLPISPAAASNLYAAVMTDTGRFSFSNTDAETHRVAQELLGRGVKPFEMYKRIYNNRTIAQLKLRALIAQTIKLEPELGYFYCTCTQQLLRETGTTEADTEGVSDMLKTVGGYDISFFIKEQPAGDVKVSARSNSGFNVQQLAQRLGGGGHPAAAGFRLDAGVAEAPAVIRRAMREALEPAGQG